MPAKADNIPFSKPAKSGKEAVCLKEALDQPDLTEGKFNQQCREWLERTLPSIRVYLTSSCTHALEMAALLMDFQPGDEIIMPSFTFVSAANAFALRGGVPVFIDIRPDTMNMDETLIEQAITPRTRAIMVMHYGGVACEMEAIQAIASRHNLPIIEDAAHALMAKWRNRSLGTLGTISTISFHQTKNFTAGEGGAIIFNDPTHIKRADILRYKGTNRIDFMNGTAAHYTWVDLGSSWTMNELNAAYLYGNLLSAGDILKKRHALWDFYALHLKPFADRGLITLPVIPADCQHNAHIFYLKVQDEATRNRFLAYLRERNVGAVFHYVPLHSSPAGKKYGRFHGEDKFTTLESKRLVRLPLFYNMSMEQAERVVSAIKGFYDE